MNKLQAIYEHNRDLPHDKRLKFEFDKRAGLLRVFEPGQARLSRRAFIGGAALAIALVPTVSKAATNFLWSGAGTYNVGRTTWLSTELNALANSTANVLSTLGAAFQNTSSWLFADTEILSGGTITPVAGAFVELWLLRSLDNAGTNYEDGSATIAPGRTSDAQIMVRAGTTITPRAGTSGLILPPAFYKPIARNQTGVSLAATSNVISFSSYTEQY